MAVFVGEAENLSASQFKAPNVWTRRPVMYSPSKASRPRSALESRWFESLLRNPRSWHLMPMKVVWQWTHSLGKEQHAHDVLPPSSASVFYPSSSILDGTLHIQGRSSIPIFLRCCPTCSVISGNAQKCMLLIC